ncbi:MAG: ribonuclease HI family protein [Chloroflexi bacterium]|nr:ribonuclease HI family protein [Chloroflexota bacterium]
MPRTNQGPDLRVIAIHSDGASQGNPGLAGAGGVVQAGGTVLETISEPLGVMTCNQAEYNALLFALKAALKYRPERLDCFLDSELVVKQLKGEYKVRDATLQRLYQQVIELIKQVEEVSFTHVPRERNAKSDRLATQAITAQKRVRRKPV